MLQELERLLLGLVSFSSCFLAQFPKILLMLHFKILTSDVRDFQVANDATTADEGFA